MSEYSAMAAKLKAMRGRSLSSEDFEELLNQTSVVGICNYLKGTDGYGDLLKGLSDKDAHRGIIESMLQRGMMEEYTRLYNFMTQKERQIMSYWFMRHEIEYIKNQVRHVYTNEQISTNPIMEAFNKFFEVHSKIKTDVMENATSISDCIDACADTQYYGILKRAEEIDADFFSMGMMLDNYYYHSLWRLKDKVLEKSQRGPLEEVLGSKIDMLNMMWIYRGKRYFKFDNDVIFTYLLPVHYHLNEDIIRRMVRSESIEGMIALAKNTKYADLFDGLDHGIFPEENYRRIQYGAAKHTFVTQSESIASVIAYMDLKEIEVNNIITIIEGVRYNLNKDTIREHIGISM